jgi:hypothetical protein
MCCSEVKLELDSGDIQWFSVDDESLRPFGDNGEGGAAPADASEEASMDVDNETGVPIEVRRMS